MSSDANPKLPDLDRSEAARAKLVQEDGKRFWQSLEELSETPKFHDFLKNEFPEATSPVGNRPARCAENRSGFRGTRGMSACTKLPTERIVPYVKPRKKSFPGFRCSTLRRCRGRYRQRPPGGKPHGPADKSRRLAAISHLSDAGPDSGADSGSIGNKQTSKYQEARFCATILRKSRMRALTNLCGAVVVKGVPRALELCCGTGDARVVGLNQFVED